MITSIVRLVVVIAAPMLVLFGSVGHAVAAPPESNGSRQPFCPEKFTTPEGLPIYGGSLGNTMCCRYRHVNGPCIVHHGRDDRWLHFEPVQLRRVRTTRVRGARLPHAPPGVSCARATSHPASYAPMYPAQDFPTYPTYADHSPRSLPPEAIRTERGADQAARASRIDDPPYTGPRPGYFVAEGEACFASRRYGEARMLFRRSLDWDADNGEISMRVGLGEFALGNFRRAVTYIRRGLDLDPCQIGEPPDLVAFYRDERRLAQHLSELQRFVSKHPDDADLQFLLGFILYASGDAASAASRFEHSLALGATDRSTLALFEATNRKTLSILSE